LFKIKTTNINNYIVKPNAQIIPSEHSMSIRVTTNHPLSQKIDVSSDKFLVQLTCLFDEQSLKLKPESIKMEEV
jgi:hypothetical protein